MDPLPFKYQPKCSVPGCGRPGVFKVAAPWSYGSINELKNYGVSCEAHRDAVFDRAKAENAGLAAADGEKFGPVGVYQIVPGMRDVDLTRVMQRADRTFADPDRSPAACPEGLGHDIQGWSP